MEKSAISGKFELLAGYCESIESNAKINMLATLFFFMSAPRIPKLFFS